MNQKLKDLLGGQKYCELEKLMTSEQIELVEKAYRFSAAAHEGQIRKSGHPFLYHCEQVVKILLESHMDYETICAGFLHDIIEDTEIDFDTLKKEFSEDIASLVEGVTKISSLKFSTDRERQIESLRKMLLAMAKDIRVIIIKFADRLHNMRTLKHLPKIKRLSISRNTLEIYAPLAHRLGMMAHRSELEDLAMFHLYPDEYKSLTAKIKNKKAHRDELVKTSIDYLASVLKEHNIPVEIVGRSKHFYSIYRKMKTQNLTFDQIYDLIALRVITDKVPHCYDIMGVVHHIWKPLLGRFKDYIALPKANMYQSIHITVIGLNGEQIEIQIRTQEMHRMAEAGIAAHWKYKEAKTARDEKFEQKLQWLRQLTEAIRESRDPDEFYDTVKRDIFSDIVFCLTPKGDIIEMPAGSTALDFAYHIHTEVGDRCMGVEVNGKMVSLRQKLRNYDMIRVVTSKAAHPSPDWLDIVTSGRARSKIRHWLKTQNHDHYISAGRDSLLRILRANRLQVKNTELSETLEPLFDSYHVKTIEELFVEVGFGSIKAQNVVNKLLQLMGRKVQRRKAPKAAVDSKSVLIDNIDNTLVRFARCCNPLPGDDIIGFVTRGRGVSIHKQDCKSLRYIVIQSADGESRSIAARWDLSKESQSLIDLKIIARDRKGLLADISNAIAKMNIMIMGTSHNSTPNNQAYFRFLIEISSAEQLKELLDKLSEIKSVIQITRGVRTPRK